MEDALTFRAPDKVGPERAVWGVGKDVYYRLEVAREDGGYLVSSYYRPRSFDPDAFLLKQDTTPFDLETIFVSDDQITHEGIEAFRQAAQIATSQEMEPKGEVAFDALPSIDGLDYPMDEYTAALIASNFLGTPRPR